MIKKVMKTSRIFWMQCQHHGYGDEDDDTQSYQQLPQQPHIQLPPAPQPYILNLLVFVNLSASHTKYALGRVLFAVNFHQINVNVKIVIFCNVALCKININNR